MDLRRVINGFLSLHDGVKELSGALDRAGGDLVATTTGANGMVAKTYVIDDGDRGLAQRLVRIREMTAKGKRHPDIIAYTRSILTRKDNQGNWIVPEKNWAAEVVAIFRDYRKNVRYVHDPLGVDLYAHPKRTFQMRAGDCDDALVTVGAMLLTAGYPIWAKVVNTKESPDWDHIYLLTKIPPSGPGTIYPLDPSMNKPPGWEVDASNVVRSRVFDIMGG